MLLSYSDFIDEYDRVAREWYRSDGTDNGLYREFRKFDKMLDKLEIINDNGYLKFLQKALSFNGKAFASVKNDSRDADYLLATIKNWRKSGIVDIKLSFPKDGSNFLCERIVLTGLEEKGKLGRYRSFEKVDNFLRGSLSVCYEDVMNARWIDYGEGKGELKSWDYYLGVHDNEDGVGVVSDGGGYLLTQD